MIAKKLKSIETDINTMLPDKWYVTLAIMPVTNKVDYWAYHNTSIQKENDTIVSMFTVISLNTKDIDDNKLYDEIIHEVQHLYDYSKATCFLDIIEYCNGLKS